MSKKQQKQTLNALLLVFVLFVLGVTVFMIHQQLELRQRASELPELTVTPSAQNTNEAKEMTVALGIASKKTPVNGVIIVLTYPQDKLSLQHLDTSNSPFTLQSEYLAQSGYVRLGRDATVPLQGVNHIATITFDVLQPVTVDEIQITQETKALTEDNKNIFLQPKLLLPSETVNKSHVFTNVWIWIIKTIGFK